MKSFRINLFVTMTTNIEEEEITERINECLSRLVDLDPKLRIYDCDLDIKEEDEE